MHQNINIIMYLFDLDNVLRVCLVSVSCSIIFQYCPLMVHLEELADQLKILIIY